MNNTKIKIKYELLLVISSLFVFLNANAEEKMTYRPAHDEICYKMQDINIKCGDFIIASTILAKKHDTGSAGQDVMASFSAKTHPGDHPFLNRLAKRLGYTDVSIDLDVNKSIFSWKEIDANAKSALVDKYSSIVKKPELQKILSGYLSICIDYWADPNAKHDLRKEDPSLAEVSALCVADSGILR